MAEDADVVPMRRGGGRRAPAPRPSGVPDLAGDHLNARRFLDEHGAVVRRVPELGRWLVWNGGWWEEDTLDGVLELAADTIDGLRQWVAEAPGDQIGRRARHYEASAKAGRRDALLSMAGTDPDVVVGVHQLDAHPTLLACRNGTVDLTTGELGPADPALLLTRGVDVDYDPDATSELWKGLLDRIFREDRELIAFVQRFLGYCLTGVVHEHVVAALYGPGANGKSTVVGVLQDLLGDLAITAPEGLVIRRDHEPHPERLATLRGRRMVVSSELEQRAVLAEAVVKMLSGGDTISARELYGRRFNFRPTHKVVLVTNHRPRVRGTDHAIWRRLRVVPFDAVIPAAEQDATLRQRLVRDHGPAVLAWLVRGAVAWSRDGLGGAAAVDDATAAYREAEDVFGAWCAECVVEVDRSVRTKVGDLWDSWRGWCEPAGERPGRKGEFSAVLEDRGFELVTYQGGRFVRGIGLLVRSSEDSPGTSPIHPSREPLRTRPHKTSLEGPQQEFYNRDEF